MNGTVLHVRRKNLQEGEQFCVFGDKHQEYLAICNYDTLKNYVLKALESPLLQQPNYVEQRVRKRLCKTVFIINRLYIILYLFV